MPNDYENPKYTNKNEYHAGDGPFQFPWWAIVIAFVVWWPLGLVFIGLNAAMKNGRLGGFEQKAREATRDRTASGARPVYNAEFRPIYDTPAQPQPKAAAPHAAPQQAQVRAAGKKLKGAALATISGQIVTALMAIWYLAKKNKAFRLKRASFHLSGHLLRRFLPLGISSFITQVSIVAIMAAMNNVLVIYGAKSPYGADIPMTVVGIVMKVFQIVVAIVVGIAAGCQPLVGYNYGAGHIDRVRQILKTMMAAEIAVGLVSLLCFQMFPRQITALFGSGDALYEEFAVMAFRIFLCTIPLCCVQKAGSIFLQSLGRPLEAMSLSLLREIVLSIPFEILLDGGVEGR